jgi:hypothetical protein
MRCTLFHDGLMTRALLVLIAACGSGGGAACPPPADAGPIADADLPSPLCTGTACGGDITGTWEFLAACAAGSGTLPDCSEGTVTYLHYKLTGELTIDAQGSATFTGVEDAAALGDAPLSCFNFTECEQFESAFMIAFAGTTVSCKGQFPPGKCEANATPTRCDCHSVINGPTTLNATFATSGNSLTVTLGREVIPGEYCVQNGELWIHATRFGSADIRWRLRRKS